MLARLVQLGIRQSRYFGRIKTRFQLYLAATVANLTLVAAKAVLTGETAAGPRAGSPPDCRYRQLRRQYRGRVARARHPRPGIQSAPRSGRNVPKLIPR